MLLFKTFTMAWILIFWICSTEKKVCVCVYVCLYYGLGLGANLEVQTKVIFQTVS